MDVRTKVLLWCAVFADERTDLHVCMLANLPIGAAANEQMWTLACSLNAKRRINDLSTVSVVIS